VAESPFQSFLRQPLQHGKQAVLHRERAALPSVARLAVARRMRPPRRPASAVVPLADRQMNPSEGGGQLPGHRIVCGRALRQIERWLQALAEGVQVGAVELGRSLATSVKIFSAASAMEVAPAGFAPQKPLPSAC